jgi:tetraacyldisaccharide 4'-kinase
MRAALQRAWLRRGPLAWLLAPLSLLYGLLAALHRLPWQLGWRRAWRAPVPVVVVGNVVAGGAGKTPVVIAIADWLAARGVRAGVVSRGYGRQGEGCTEVSPASDPAATGDEPLLVARRTGAPVVVARRRADAVRHLLAAHPQVQVVLSDDGLQHRALARDLEIVVFDARGTGNGWLLPAGPLREPWPRRADLVLRPPQRPELGGHVVRRRLADEAVRADGARRPLAELARAPCAAVAGIAEPEAFFAMLRGQGVPLVACTALPDHHAYAAGDVPPAPAGGHLLCTEKDAVKLWRLQPQAWAVPLAVEIEPAFWSALEAALGPRLSSADGSQAA